jgi:hypothetical protein
MATKKKKRHQEFNDVYAYSDDHFVFIAGYTSGGAPYGITWDELGIEPYAPYEEIMKAYEQLDHMGYVDGEL